jgi:hypothetical protein
MTGKVLTSSGEAAHIFGSGSVLGRLRRRQRRLGSCCVVVPGPDVSPGPFLGGAVLCPAGSENPPPPKKKKIGDPASSTYYLSTDLAFFISILALGP